MSDTDRVSAPEPEPSRPHMPGYGLLGRRRHGAPAGAGPTSGSRPRTTTGWPPLAPRKTASHAGLGRLGGVALWFSSANDSRKASNLRSHPRWSLATDNTYEPVVLEGDASVVTDLTPTPTRAGTREGEVRHRLRRRDARPRSQHVVRAPAGMGVRTQRRRLHRVADPLDVPGRETGMIEEHQGEPTTSALVAASAELLERLNAAESPLTVVSAALASLAAVARRRTGNRRDRRPRVRTAGVHFGPPAAGRQRRHALGSALHPDRARPPDRRRVGPLHHRGGHDELRTREGKPRARDPARGAPRRAAGGRGPFGALRMGIHARAHPHGLRTTGTRRTTSMRICA